MQEWQWHRCKSMTELSPVEVSVLSKFKVFFTGGLVPCFQNKVKLHHFCRFIFWILRNRPHTEFNDFQMMQAQAKEKTNLTLPFLTDCGACWKIATIPIFSHFNLSMNLCRTVALIQQKFPSNCMQQIDQQTISTQEGDVFQLHLKFLSQHLEKLKKIRLAVLSVP